jgi:signal transduction histidine kinase
MDIITIVLVALIIIMLCVITLFILIKREDRKTNDELTQIIFRLREAITKQKEAEKAKTEFLTVTSHELKTPLTPMKAQLQMYLDGYFGSVNAKQKDSLEMILSNTTRLHNLISEILDISKLESNNMKFIMQKNDMLKSIDSAIQVMRPKADEKKISLTFASEKNLPIFVFDSERITQVVVNLVSNAIKFTPEKGKVQIVIKKEKDKVQVKVIDTGIGIKKKDIATLFKPFKQVDSSMYRNFEGSGLGLAICKGIIRHHSGKFAVESIPGKGSIFSFTIPYGLKEEKSESRIFA